jgi:hypothetical protein
MTAVARTSVAELRHDWAAPGGQLRAFLIRRRAIAVSRLLAKLGALADRGRPARPNDLPPEFFRFPPF